MCGIAGTIETKSTSDAARCRLEAMAGALAHRGPDDQGVWFDAAAGVGLASRRLAIIDVSPDGHQPMVSASGRYVIAFNGEIYNFPDLRREIEQLGDAHFHGHSDTEVLLAAIEQWGLVPAIQRSVGMFAFALWDRTTHTLHLGRDRLGEKPLYYGWCGETFLFGSELKALRAHPAFRAGIDRGALTLYVRSAYVPAPYSIYEGIFKLLPGTILSLHCDTLTPGCLPEPAPYWSARDVAERGIADPCPGTAEEAIAELDRLLRTAVRGQMVADVPLGAFLSGGVDSSTVVALMQAQHDRPVKSFTIGFHEATHNEARDAAAVATHLGLDHTELYVTPDDAMAVIPQLPTLYDEPFADSSQIPTFLVSQLAREHVTVALSGDGGDELFAGYNRHLWAPKVADRTNRVPQFARRAAAAGMLALSPRRWDQLYEAVEPALPAGIRQRTPGDHMQKLGTMLRAETNIGMYRSLTTTWEPNTIMRGGAAPDSFAMDGVRWPALDGFRSEMLLLDLLTYLPDDILVKVDRASMGVSLEARAPYLDHRVVEFAWRLPAEMKICHGTGKWILRRVLDRYVPRTLIDRPKTGFGIPIGDWLRGPLRSWAEDLLDEDRLRSDGFFNPAPIQITWSEHLSGRRTWAQQLWTILMFQAWLDTTGKP